MVEVERWQGYHHSRAIGCLINLHGYSMMDKSGAIKNDESDLSKNGRAMLELESKWLRLA